MRLRPGRTTGIVVPEQRYFTVEDANAVLPLLEAWLTTMRNAKREMESLSDEITPVIERAHLNSGGASASRFVRALHAYNELAAHIEEEGIQLRDVEMGLVDFPSRRFEREIHLCWRSGEPEVLYWHEVNAGFQNRRRLDEVTEKDLHSPGDT
jgi:hypothetical protein